MGVFLNRSAANRRPDNPEPDCITIGLVNNMPDSALGTAERQFVSLLAAAADRTPVWLMFYALPGVPRTESGQRHISSYCKINDLWNSQLDGLIVTGTDPRATNLVNEPCWPDLCQLVDWADHNTHSSVWSCLSAHAAALHIDDIERKLLDEKRFGVFDCYPVEKDLLTFGIPRRLRMPHSRWNEIPSEMLLSSGYRILTMSMDAGVDMWTKQRKSLFVFFQGHPEYEADTLLSEYRRDIRRFLKGERAFYPELPQGCFTEEAAERLTAFQKRAVAARAEEILIDLPRAKPAVESWRPHAVQIYRNWLAYLAGQKASRRKAAAIFRGPTPVPQ